MARAYDVSGDRNRAIARGERVRQSDIVLYWRSPLAAKGRVRAILHNTRAIASPFPTADFPFPILVNPELLMTLTIVKRLVLSFLTVVALFLVSVSLVESWNQPQIQSRLELYQTNLLLHAAQVQLGEEQPGMAGTETLIGATPYETALKQYRDALESVEDNLDRAQQQLEEAVVVNPSVPQTVPQTPTPPLVDPSGVSPQTSKLTQTIAKLETLRNELTLKIGILEAHTSQVAAGRSRWQQLGDRPSVANNASFLKTLQAVTGIWSDPPRLLPNTEAIVNENLDGWFRYRVLRELYQRQQRPDALATLEAKEADIGRDALLKLALLTGLPGLGFVLGLILLLFVAISRLVKGKEALLARHEDEVWQTPWDWETIWQVLILGFFFVGQILVPVILSLGTSALGWQMGSLNVRTQALYILASYIMLAGGGLSVLYFSVRSFFPLPEGWFRFRWRGNWILWGVGGYLTALPLVILVSALNQQFWQGRGGSNPILPIALEGRDSFALSVFFLTASVAAPMFEEIMFRGFLLPSLTRYFSVPSAIIFSSLLFAIAHLNLSEVLPLVTLGLVLGVVYTRSRNLLAPMLLHSLWNSGTLVSLFLLGSGAS